MKQTINDKIDTVMQYSIDSGWDVEFNNNDIEDSLCDPVTKTITINVTGLKNRLYTLLHETGHSIIFESDEYSELFGEIAKQSHLKHSEQNNHFHYQVLKEEMLAWETGLNIADVLDIDIDKYDYDSYASEQYMTYVYRASLNYYQNEVKIISKKANIDIDFTEPV